MAEKIVVSGTGCCLVDLLYNNIDFNSEGSALSFQGHGVTEDLPRGSSYSRRSLKNSPGSHLPKCNK
jgi:hypothetical protein